ncbi:MAG: sigma-54 dependent transcriptional regulator [Proteobacteria bacterium]|nr:sigma-54 dependent transcriptional regulator [Pseudomonadota bacterium]
MSPPEPGCILVIDDEENMRLVLKTILEREGYRVRQASDGREGLDVLAGGGVDLVLCDVRMPNMDGAAFLHEAVGRDAAAPVIMMSAYGTVDSAVQALKAGAVDYVFKPFQPDEVLLKLKRALEREILKRENLALRRAAAQEPPFGIVARSPCMKDLLTLIDRMAQVKSPVLITGESGTGKELVARALHRAGPRRDQPFVPVNCGAIPDQLLESELFGHVRGAFTDARQDRAGLFREADRGTLFLDEVGELPLALQVKLLRALQEDEVRPVGGAASVRVDLRIVAATARDLAAEVGQGRFREDLYYRLNVLPLSIPPLRERKADVPLLIDHFLIALSARMSRRRPDLDPAAAQALIDYSWPGNVRELENLIERLLVLVHKPVIEPGDLPPHILAGGVPPTATPNRPADLDLKARLRDVEAEVIRMALEETGGNRSEAARRLKISYPSLLTKIKAYGL